MYSSVGCPSNHHADNGNSDDTGGGNGAPAFGQPVGQRSPPIRTGSAGSMPGSGQQARIAEFRQEWRAHLEASYDSEQKHQDGDGNGEQGSLEEKKYERPQDGTAISAHVRDWGKHNGVTLYAVEVEVSGRREARKLYRR